MNVSQNKNTALMGEKQTTQTKCNGIVWDDKGWQRLQEQFLKNSALEKYVSRATNCEVVMIKIDKVGRQIIIEITTKIVLKPGILWQEEKRKCKITFETEP